MKYEGLKVGQSIRNLRKKHDMSMADFDKYILEIGNDELLD